MCIRDRCWVCLVVGWNDGELVAVKTRVDHNDNFNDEICRKEGWIDCVENPDKHEIYDGFYYALTFDMTDLMHVHIIDGFDLGEKIHYSLNEDFLEIVILGRKLSPQEEESFLKFLDKKENEND